VPWPRPIARALRWLEPESSRPTWQEPPGNPRIDWIVVAFLVPTTPFTALVFGAPFMLPPGSTGDLTGSVGNIENAGVWSAFPEPQQWVYRAGDIACHTKSYRSFVLGGNQMPFCARDIAIFAGMTAGLALCVSPRLRPYRFAVTLPWWAFLALLAPIALDGGAQDFLGFESENWRRVVTGFPAGLAVAFALAFIAYESHFAARRAREARIERRAREQRGSEAPNHGEGDGASAGPTGSWGSKAVDSVPTEKKKTLSP
jgi:uncharacterized membrane protein